MEFASSIKCCNWEISNSSSSLSISSVLLSLFSLSSSSKSSDSSSKVSSASSSSISDMFKSSAGNPSCNFKRRSRIVCKVCVTAEIEEAITFRITSVVSCF